MSALEPMQLYGLSGGAIIGAELLEEVLQGPEDQLVIIGHSMGAITASDLAVEQAARRSVVLVLVSPAFLVRGKEEAKEALAASGARRQLSRARLLQLRIFRSIVRAILQLPGLVYSRGFWERSLSSVVFSASRMGQQRFALQVLRYRWPSLCQGWALGLANFVVARLAGGLEEDADALRRLRAATPHAARAPSAGPGLRLLIVAGSQDKVIPVKLSRKLQSLLGCELVTLEGCGHCCHEEDPQGFAQLVANFVRRGVLPDASELRR